MAGIVAGDQLFYLDGLQESGSRIETLRLLRLAQRQGRVPQAQASALGSRMLRAFHV